MFYLSLICTSIRYRRDPLGVCCGCCVRPPSVTLSRFATRHGRLAVPSRCLAGIPSEKFKKQFITEESDFVSEDYLPPYNQIFSPPAEVRRGDVVRHCTTSRDKDRPSTRFRDSAFHRTEPYRINKPRSRRRSRKSRSCPLGPPAARRSPCMSTREVPYEYSDELIS